MLLVLSAILYASAVDAGDQPVINKPQISKPDSRRIREAHERPGSPPAIDMDRLIQVAGTVVYPVGHPVANARVHLSKDSWTDPIELGKTREDGTFRFQVPEKAFHRFEDGTVGQSVTASLIVTAAGFGATWAALPVNQRAATDPKLGSWQVMLDSYQQDFQLVSDRSISGRVTNQQNQPIANARIQVTRVFPIEAWPTIHNVIQTRRLDSLDRKALTSPELSGGLHRTAWNLLPTMATDDNGSFQISGLGENRIIGLHVDGPAISPVDLIVITRDGLDEFTAQVRERFPQVLSEKKVLEPSINLFGSQVHLAADSAFTVSGIVRDSATGQPVQGVRIGSWSDRTDRDGRYRFVRSPEVTHLWLSAETAQSDQYLPALYRVETPRESGEVTFDVSLNHGVLIQGKVLEAGTDRPIVSGARSTCHCLWSGARLAGEVIYVPLESNLDLREKAEGAYFLGPPNQVADIYGAARSLHASISADGQFQIAVPSGPGVLLVRSQPGTPFMSMLSNPWSENAGMHLQYPYRPLTSRVANDGVSGGDAGSLPGFAGRLKIGENNSSTGIHAYQVINPPVNSDPIHLTISIARAPSRRLKFVGSDGNALNGVIVEGLTSPEHRTQVVLNSSEAEALALDVEESREILAMSVDGKWLAQERIDASDLSPKVISFRHSATVIGTLIDERTNAPLAECDLMVSYPHDQNQFARSSLATSIKTDSEGRFSLNGLFPDEVVSISIQQRLPGAFVRPRTFSPQPLQKLTLQSGEQRDLREIRVHP